MLCLGFLPRIALGVGIGGLARVASLVSDLTVGKGVMPEEVVVVEVEVGEETLTPLTLGSLLGVAGEVVTTGGHIFTPDVFLVVVNELEGVLRGDLSGDLTGEKGVD
jgi:hypothetical protein